MYIRDAAEKRSGHLIPDVTFCGNDDNADGIFEVRATFITDGIPHEKILRVSEGVLDDGGAKFGQFVHDTFLRAMASWSLAARVQESRKHIDIWDGPGFEDLRAEAVARAREEVKELKEFRSKPS